MRHAFVCLVLLLMPASLAAQQSSPPPEKALADPDLKPFVPAIGPDLRELAVSVLNRSEPVLCAEKDNVELSFASPKVRSFRIEAVHPAYVGMIASDRWAYDLKSCDMRGEPQFYAEPRRVTLWENYQMWLVGYTFPNFWRKADVPVRIGDHVERGLHMLQLWVKYRERGEEVLVIYPPDGYWRLRPLPFGDLRWSAYGSSFLLGPVDRDARPYVAMKEIAFDPVARSFSLSFADGSSAQVALATLDQEKFDLQVTLDKPVANRPFLALRSMYTTKTNADVAEVAWRTKAGPGWGEAPVMAFPGAEATELWAGRTVPSRHNLSAPDMVFSRFFAEPESASAGVSGK